MSATLAQKIDALRTAGNGHFARGAWKESVTAYTQAIDAYHRGGYSDDDQPTVLAASRRLASTLFSTASSLFSPTSPTAAATTPQSTANDPTPSAVTATEVHLHTLYSNRSAALLMLKRADEALADAEKVIQLRPDWPKGYYRKAEALVTLRRFDEALACFHRALEKYPPGDASSQLIHSRISHTAFQLEDESANIRIVQLLAGRDFAVSTWSPVSALIYNAAKSLQNFVYAIGCQLTKECVLVDPCWDLDGILAAVNDAGFRVVGTIVTHYHFDHVGGKPPPPYDQYRVKVDGLVRLLAKLPTIKAYIHQEDVTGVMEANSDLPLDRVQQTNDNYTLSVGRSISIRFIHTPGHTPGSQCLLVNGRRLFSGDTLFIGSVGRLDFPDSDARQMYASMQKLKALAGSANDHGAAVMIYPGHNYGGTFTTLKTEISTNRMMCAQSLGSFLGATGQ